MPLQKLHPPGAPVVDSQALKRRQLQERRRTLQTISELSATEATPPDFRTSLGNGQTTTTGRSGVPSQGRKIPNLNKRQSLPQFCARPECVQTRSPPPVPSIHIVAAQRPPLEHKSHAKASPRQEAGWNARRERARLQAEQALSGTNLRSEPSIISLQSGSPAPPNISPFPHPKSSQPYLRSYYSREHSLRGSRSMTGTPLQSEQRSSTGSTSARHVVQREHDVDSSERASTDSSSFRSSRESAMRRSRSSSSSQSFTLQGVPPLPSGCAQPTNAYYSALHSHYHNGYPFQLPGPMYAHAPSTMQTAALPYVRLDGTSGVPRNSYTGVAHALRSNPPHEHGQKKQGLVIHASSVPVLTKQPSQSSQSSTKSRHRRVSTQQNQHPPSPSPHHRNSNRSPSTPKPPPKAHIPVHPSSTTNTTSSPSSASFPSAANQPQQPLTPRAIPSRESLSKWNSERLEARAEFNGMQRARVKERVRRANEMEREKERELQKLGKGAEKAARVLGKGLSGDEEKRRKGDKGGKNGGTKKEKERGCLGGWVGRVVGEWRW